MKPALAPAFALVLMLALAGCGGKEEKKGGKHNEADRAAAIAAAQGESNATVSATVAPTSIPESYAEFPAEVRASIYRWDLLNQKCSGKFQTKDQGACVERETLSKDLLAKGWCFGGADEPAAMHWVLCAEDYPGGEGYIAGPKADELPDQ